jgi:hypothetical protein
MNNAVTIRKHKLADLLAKNYSLHAVEFNTDDDDDKRYPDVYYYDDSFLIKLRFHYCNYFETNSENGLYLSIIYNDDDGELYTLDVDKKEALKAFLKRLNPYYTNLQKLENKKDADIYFECMFKGLKNSLYKTSYSRLADIIDNTKIFAVTIVPNETSALILDKFDRFFRNKYSHVYAESDNLEDFSIKTHQFIYKVQREAYFLVANCLINEITDSAIECWY